MIVLLSTRIASLMNDSRKNYISFKEKSVQGRYIVQEQIDDFLENKAARFEVSTEGVSVQNRTIKSIVLGSGKQKILMWSQMHGNESTTTKAVLDLINCLDMASDVVSGLAGASDKGAGSDDGTKFNLPLCSHPAPAM